MTGVTEGNETTLSVDFLSTHPQYDYHRKTNIEEVMRELRTFQSGSILEIVSVTRMQLFNQTIIHIAFS